METQQIVQMDKRLLDFINKWKGKKGKEIMILHKVQEIYGFVPRAVAVEVSRLIDLPLAKIYGIITFYHIFKLKKPGKYQISVCMGTACYVGGTPQLVDKAKQLIGINMGETTEDGNITMEECRCVGACSQAPVVVVDEVIHGRVKPSKVAQLVRSIQTQD